MRDNNNIMDNNNKKGHRVLYCYLIIISVWLIVGNIINININININRTTTMTNNNNKDDLLLIHKQKQQDQQRGEVQQLTTTTITTTGINDDNDDDDIDNNNNNNNNDDDDDDDTNNTMIDMISTPKQWRELLLKLTTNTNTQTQTTQSNNQSNPFKILYVRNASVSKEVGGCGVSMALEFDYLDYLDMNMESYANKTKTTNIINNIDNNNNDNNNNNNNQTSPKTTIKTYYKNQISLSNEKINTKSSTESHLREIMSSYFDELLNLQVVIPTVGYRLHLHKQHSREGGERDNNNNNDVNNVNNVSSYHLDKRQKLIDGSMDTKIEMIRSCISCQSLLQLDDEEKERDDDFYVNGSMMIWKDGIEHISKDEIIASALMTKPKTITTMSEQEERSESVLLLIDSAVRYIIFQYLGGCKKSNRNNFAIIKEEDNNTIIKEYVAIDNDRCFTPTKITTKLELYNLSNHKIDDYRIWKLLTLGRIPCENYPHDITKRIFELVVKQVQQPSSSSLSDSSVKEVGKEGGGGGGTLLRGSNYNDNNKDYEKEPSAFGGGVVGHSTTTTTTTTSLVSSEFKRLLQQDILGDQILNYQPEIFNEIDDRILLFVDRLNRCKIEMMNG